MWSSLRHGTTTGFQATAGDTTFGTPDCLGGAGSCAEAIVGRSGLVEGGLSPLAAVAGGGRIGQGVRPHPKGTQCRRVGSMDSTGGGAIDPGGSPAVRTDSSKGLGRRGGSCEAALEPGPGGRPDQSPEVGQTP